MIEVEKRGIMSVFPSDKLSFFYEFEAASRKLLKSTSETFDASLVVLKNQPGQLSVHEVFSYMCSGYRSEKFIPFGCAWLYFVERCTLLNKQISFWDAFNLKDIIRCLFPHDTVYSRYPYQEDTINQWCTHTVTEDASGETKTFNILNMEGRPGNGKPYPLLNRQIFPNSLQEDGFKVLFHGTNRDSAVDIIEQGIDLQKGKPKQDFSDGRGFYLNDKYKATENFAFTKEKPAIIIFKLRLSEFEIYEGKSINFQDDDHPTSEWKEFVKTCRGELKSSKDFKRELKKATYVEGPMASITRRPNGTFRVNEDIEGSYQMCLHSKKIAEVFNRHMHSVVFF